MQILPEIDDLLSAAAHPLTKTQVNFLRDVTIRNFYGTDTPFTAEELAWLIARFDEEPTPQRAVMIAMLISPESLRSETSGLIRSVLVGTPGECWAD